MKAKHVEISKSMQRRVAMQSEPLGCRGEKPPKNPKVPIFPPEVARLVNKLNDIIDTDVDPERKSWAYGLLTRVCVIWTPPFQVDWPKVTVDYVQETGLLHFDNELLRDTAMLMSFLFPDGNGLPTQEEQPASP